MRYQIQEGVLQLGAIFPQSEIGADPAGVQEFAQAAGDLGYEHLSLFDHMLGADAIKRESWELPCSTADMFQVLSVFFRQCAFLAQNVGYGALHGHGVRIKKPTAKYAVAISEHHATHPASARRPDGAGPQTQRMRRQGRS